MNRILLHILSLLLVITCSSQVNSDRGEFATNPNGLMYNDNDMKTLRFIVDSLNLRFKSCDLNKTYYAYPQTPVYSISFRSTSNDLKEIIEEIEKKTNFQQIAYRFTAYINRIDSNELSIRTGTRNGGEGYYYLHGNPGDGYGEVQLDEKHATADKNIINDWIYDYSPKDQYSKEYSLICRYFPGTWKKQSIPDKYARLIQYVDCMIDTSSSIFLTDKFSNGWIDEDKGNHYYNLTALADFLDEKMSQKKINNKNIKRLRESQVAFAAKELKDDMQFKQLLSKTIDDYIKNQTPDHQLESLARQLSMYDKELLMKRSYRIMGSCSQDSRPREHARDIAVLSAQAHS